MTVQDEQSYTDDDGNDAFYSSSIEPEDDRRWIGPVVIALVVCLTAFVTYQVGRHTGFAEGSYAGLAYCLGAEL